MLQWSWRVSTDGTVASAGQRGDHEDSPVGQVIMMTTDTPAVRLTTVGQSSLL